MMFSDTNIAPTSGVGLPLSPTAYQLGYRAQGTGLLAGTASVHKQATRILDLRSINHQPTQFLSSSVVVVAGSG